MKWCFLLNNASFLMEFLGKLAKEAKARGDACVVLADGKIAEYGKKKYFPKSAKFFSKGDWYVERYNRKKTCSEQISWKPLFTPVRAQGLSLSYEEARDTVANLCQFFDYIFENEKPDIVVSEPPADLFGEIAFCYAKKYNIPFRGFIESRIDGRVDVYDEEWTNSSYEESFQKLKDSDIPKEERKFLSLYLKNFLSHERVPSYEHYQKIRFSQFGLLRHYARRIREIGRLLLRYLRERGKSKKIDCESEVVLRRSFRAPFAAWGRQQRIRAQKRFFSPPVPGDKFFIYPVHLQPEGSTSVWATYYYDQVSSIRNIAFTLPFPYKLYVKEHPSAVGMQPDSFYQQLKEIPNVHLIAPAENLQELIQASVGTIVLTSTVGMESALAGKPTYVLGNAFYSYHPMCRRVRNFDHLRETLEKDLKNPPAFSDFEDINLRFLASYLRNTLPASIFEASVPHDTNQYLSILKKLEASLRGGAASSLAVPQRTQQCPVCKRESEFLLLQSYLSKDGEFTLKECKKCGVQFWDPLKNPGPESHWYEGKRKARKIEEILRPKISRDYHKRFLLEHASLQGKKILDVGCGTGEFLGGAQALGAECWGVDFDRTAVSLARKHFGLKNVYAMSVDEFFSKVQAPQFDFVTCFEVIEHVENPLSLLKSMEKLVKPKGTLVLSVPSRERFAVNLNTWDFPPNHLTRWNKRALEALGSLAGLRLVSLSFVEQFRILLESVNGRFRFGLVKKAAGLTKDEKVSGIFTSVLVALAQVKEYAIGFFPAAILWLWGRGTSGKNGVMVAEFKKA